jgi:hypothetical protein
MFCLIKQDSYAVSAERDKISRYTDIERKNKSRADFAHALR